MAEEEIKREKEQVQVKEQNKMLPDALAVSNRLRTALLRLSRALRNEARDLGVTSIQASLMGAIERAGQIGLGELAEQEHLSAPTMVKHIDKLEEAGFVDRKRNCSSDRRRIELQITEEGRKKVVELRARRTAWLASRLDKLEPDEQRAVADAIEPLLKLAGKTGR